MKLTQTIRLFWLCIILYWVSILASAADKGPVSGRINTVAAKPEQVKCYQFPNHLIIEKSHRNSVGNDFLVKYKADENVKLQCSYSPEKNDFEIKNEWAAYFWTIKNNLMFLQHYTGPGPFVFSVWDLAKRQKVFESSCDAPEFYDSSMGYWLETGGADKENCPELSDWEKHGLGGAVETWVILDLTNFKISETDKTRCSPRQ